MSVVSSRLAGVPLRLITDLGEDLTLRQTAAGTFDTATQTYSGETVTTTAIKGSLSPFDSREIDGTNVVVGDVRAYVSGRALSDAGVTPAVGDHIDRAGTRFRVQRADLRRADTDDLLWILHLRGVK